MKIIKTVVEKNLTVHFVDSLEGHSIQLFCNTEGKTTHKKSAYSDQEIKNPKKGEKKTVKIRKDYSSYILIVEQRENFPNKYTIYIRHSTDIREICICENYIITKELLSCINKCIKDENNYNRYTNYPEFVQKCIPFEDIDSFEKAISDKRGCKNKFENIKVLKFAIGSPLVCGWLSKMGITSSSKEQEEIDHLALYIAKILVERMPDLEKEIIYEQLSPYMKD